MKPLTLFALILTVVAILVVGLWILPSRGIGAAPAAPTTAVNHMGHGQGAMVHGSAQDMAMMNALGGLTGSDFDRAFLSAMIPHHQAAVRMGEAVLVTTADPQVRAWAQAIVGAQNREIAQMTRLLEPLGGPDPRMAEEMEGMMQSMVAETTSAPDRDRAFVEGMLPHHASAIMMATMALTQSSNPEVLDLGREIVQEQAREMREFRQRVR